MAKTKDEDAPTQFVLTEEQLQKLLAGAKGGDSDELLRKQAEYQAEANRKAMRPENERAPGVSVFNPAGERDYPKAKLKCEMTWVGYPLDPRNLTPEEVDVLNRAEIGEYLFHRTDGSEEKLTVDGRTDAKGQVRKLLFYFPCRGDNKANLPGMVPMLREAFGLPTPEQAELARLRKEVETLQAVVTNA